jgi:peptidoglycan/xylan/chitin deacetylase (PgdA/CDA1 family)
MTERLRHVAHYLVAIALYYSGAIALWNLVRRREAVVLGVHRVLTPEEAERSYSEPAMVILLPTFRRMIELLRSEFEVLTLGRFTGGARANGKPACLLTFDDGWIDTYQNAYPVLKELALPAAVFAPTAVIDKRQCLWPERVSAIWRAAQSRNAMPEAVLSEVSNSKVTNLLDAIAVLKQVRVAERECILRQFAERCGEAKPTAVDSLMSWQQLLSMAPEIEAGSHTSNHVLLDVEDPATARRELEESRRQLEARTHRDVRAIAYPSGSHNPCVAELAAAAGYEWAFTTSNGRYRRGDDPLAVPRCLLQEGNITTPWGSFSPAMFHLRLAGWN